MLQKLSREELEIHVKKMIKVYSNDLSPTMLDELLHLKKIHKSIFQTEIEISPLKLLNEIYAKKLETIFYEYFCCFKDILYNPNDCLQSRKSIFLGFNQPRTTQFPCTFID